MPAHHGQHRPGDVHRAKEVGLDLPAELLRADLLEEAGDEVPGVVHEHIDVAEPLHGSLRGGLSVGGVCHVELDDEQVVSLAQHDEIREFLASRRAKITPEQAGLRSYAGTRRVPGLRRGEVAEMAAVSIEYYTRLERGNLAGVSEAVLAGLSRALQLDEAERARLFDLARASGLGNRWRRRPAPNQRIRPGVQLALDAITGAPAFVGNERLDIHSEMFANPARPANHARFIFFDDRARSFYRDCDRAAAGSGFDPLIHPL